MPFYRRWFQESGITPAEIAEARDLGPLPIISKTMIQAAPQDFRAAAPPEGSYAKSTGGTLGQPLHLLVSPLSDQWRMAVSRRGLCLGRMRARSKAGAPLERRPGPPALEDRAQAGPAPGFAAPALCGLLPHAGARTGAGGHGDHRPLRPGEPGGLSLRGRGPGPPGPGDGLAPPASRW